MKANDQNNEKVTETLRFCHFSEPKYLRTFPV